MGCCGSKNDIEVKEEEKPEEHKNEEIEIEKEEPEEQVEEMEKHSIDLVQKEEEKVPEEENNKQEIAVEVEEKKEEEIVEDIQIDEVENIEYQSLPKNFNANPLEKSSEKLKGSMNKPITKKKKKVIPKKIKPFVILEVQSSPYQKVKIQINACAFRDEYMMPIWCPKNVYIKFRVEGKWRIDKTYDYTDSKGIPSNNCAGFNYGALIGRIGIGEKFMVVDEGTFLVKKEGPLFLRQNLPKNMKLEPDGKLELSVYDGICMSVEEINRRIGWIENGTVENNNDSENIEKSTNDKNSIENKENSPIKRTVGISNTKLDEKELEKKLRTHLNNLRMNPSMFYEKYINFNTSLIWTQKYLSKIKNEEIASLPENETCYKFLEEYFKLPNQTQFRKNLNKNNISANLSKLDEDINYFIYDQLGVTVKTKSKITQKDNPNEIIIQYLLDKSFRSYIFDTRSQFLNIKIFKNFFLNSTIVIMSIILDKDYSKEEI